MNIGDSDRRLIFYDNPVTEILVIMCNHLYNTSSTPTSGKKQFADLEEYIQQVDQSLEMLHPIYIYTHIMYIILYILCYRYSSTMGMFFILD